MVLVVIMMKEMGLKYTKGKHHNSYYYAQEVGIIIRDKVHNIWLCVWHEQETLKYTEPSGSNKVPLICLFCNFIYYLKIQCWAETYSFVFTGIITGLIFTVTKCWQSTLSECECTPFKLIMRDLQQQFIEEKWVVYEFFVAFSILILIHNHVSTGIHWLRQNSFKTHLN